MNMFRRCFTLMPSAVSLALIFILSSPLVPAQRFVRSDQPAESEGLQGSLVIVGGGAIPESVRDWFADAVTDDGSVVVLSAASEESDSAGRKAVEWLNAAGLTDVVVPDPKMEKQQHLQELSGCLGDAWGVWICGGQQSRLADLYQGTSVESALQELVQRGGVVGGTSAGAAIMSQVMIASGRNEPRISTGLDLLPGAIIDQHFSQRQRSGRSRLAVAAHPDRFGIGIDEGTAAIVSGRQIRVLGDGSVTILLAESAHYPAEETILKSGETADLTQLRRASRVRASGEDPGQRLLGLPRVDQGALVIVGGGGMPDSIVNRFVELAGGSDARIVVLPTALPRREAFRQGVPRFLNEASVAEVRVLPHSRPEELASDDFQQALKSATGVWFGGGRQWNFVDAYEGTAAVELFRDVLRRGGVIGGSSAGATIQGEYLVRGHPLGNTVMMAEGYERGFGFLPGTAIDQHFSQRGRKPDLIPVIQRRPQLLGIGLDEGTAIVVQGMTAEVIGDHSAHFLTAEQLKNFTAEQLQAPTAETLQRVYVSSAAGTTVDLTQFVIDGGD